MGEILYNSNHNTVGLVLLQERTVKMKSELISWSTVEIKAVSKQKTHNKQQNKEQSK